MIRILSAMILLFALLSPARAGESRAMLAVQQILDQAHTSATDCTRASEALVSILCAKQLRVGLRSYSRCVMRVIHFQASKSISPVASPTFLAFACCRSPLIPRPVSRWSPTATSISSSRRLVTTRSATVRCASSGPTTTHHSPWLSARGTAPCTTGAILSAGPFACRRVPSRT
jgi:hypothetical protein